MLKRLILFGLCGLLFVTTSWAASISGQVTYDDYEFLDIILIIAFDENLNDAGMATLLFGPGSFSINNLGDGEYRLVATVSKDNNLLQIGPGEPFSGYELNPVLIANDQDVTGVDIMIRSEAIQGTITYTGEETGTITVTAFHSDFAQGIFPANINQMDDSGDFNMIGFQPGTYYVGAYLDINGNLFPEPQTEPFAIYSDAATALPIPVDVTENGVVTGIDLVLNDLPGSSINGSVTWAGEPPGPIVLALLTDPDDLSSITRVALSFAPGEYRVYVEPGTYYLLGYVDINGNLLPEIGIDATGFYGADQPQPITVGTDETAIGIDITLAIETIGIENDASASQYMPKVRAYPNPCPISRRPVNIGYCLPQTTNARLLIYDISGRQVYRRDLGYHQAGQNYHTQWNGQDLANRPVSAGIYLCAVEWETGRTANRMVLLP